MVSDDERRKVARSLRLLGDDLREGRRSRIRLDDIRRVVFGHECPSLITDRLADLVEPSCDRDALLSLADERTPCSSRATMPRRVVRRSPLSEALSKRMVSLWVPDR